MKQSPSEANPILILLLALALVSSGCVRRTMEPGTLETRSRTSTVHVRKVNLNNASAEELEALPGIGRVIAERIVEHRAHHGPFRRIEQVMLVRGISERKFLEIEPFVTVH